jgi:hypothetical protein
MTREPTDEEALVLRRAARVIATTTLWDEAPETQARLQDLADYCDAPYLCEGCDEPATCEDVEGVPLCEECGIAAQKEEG